MNEQGEQGRMNSLSVKNRSAQADKGDQFQFISIRNEKTEWNWTKYDAIEAGGHVNQFILFHFN